MARCSRGKSCGATCINSSRKCVIDLGPKASADVKKVVENLGVVQMYHAVVAKGDRGAAARFHSIQQQLKQEVGGRINKEHRAELQRRLQEAGLLSKAGKTEKAASSVKVDDIAKAEQKLASIQRRGVEAMKAKDDAAFNKALDEQMIAMKELDLARLRGERAGLLGPVGSVRRKELDANIPIFEKELKHLARQASSKEEEKEKYASMQPVAFRSKAEMDKAYKKGETLGKGAMGEVRRDSGPPPTIIKKGEIGQYEAAALKRLEGTGVAPKLLGDTKVTGVKEVDYGLGGHVTSGKGMLQMSEAPGQPLAQSRWGMNYSERTRVIDGLMEARAKMHLAGVAHNDMHNGNVFYDSKTGKVQIVDFGLSQVSYKAALAEALGTGRSGDFQSRETFEDEGPRTASNRYDRFNLNRLKVERQYKIPEQKGQNEAQIREKENERPDWLRNMSEDQAKEALEKLYDRV